MNLAHRYWNSEWSHARNFAVYGELASKDGIGSALKLEACARARTDAELSFSSHLRALTEACQAISGWREGISEGFAEKFAERFAGKFDEEASTLERVCARLGQVLFSRALADGEWAYLRVWEGANLCCVRTPGAEECLMLQKVLNLTMGFRSTIDPVSGLALDRESAWRVVREIAPDFGGPARGTSAEWARELFQALRSRMESLCSLRVDLARQESLLVRT
ncbi:MAG: hypothetical protein HC902_04785 [Calothrix sp. SM1_5_4]|nr:hypothetical protein [Calothrix sp. SM1_5_4]